MSFTQDQGQPNEGDQLTFKVGDREFDATSAATKIGAADEHIGRIEQENAAHQARIAELEAQVSQSTKLDEALSQLREQQASTQNIQTPTETSAVSEEQIGAIATKQMEQYLAEQRVAQEQLAAQTLAESTYRETGEQLTAVYGDKVDEVMSEKAKELGISTEAIYNMAKTPATAKMLLETMKANVPASQATPSGSINFAGQHGTAPEKFMDYGDKITSSTLIEALKKAGATY